MTIVVYIATIVFIIITFNIMVSLVSFLCVLYAHKVIACPYRVGMPLSFYRREDLPKVPQLKGSDMGLEDMIPVGSLCNLSLRGD